MDFYKIRERQVKDYVEIYADFTVGRSKDLMVRGNSFYAVWDEAIGLWSTDEYDIQRLIDEDLSRYAERYREANNKEPSVQYLGSFNSNRWTVFKKFIRNIDDHRQQLDSKITFANTVVKKTDYVSKRLPYSIEEGECTAWSELIETLYEPEERAKIEWAIGAVIAGDAKKIQKFLVFYGPFGTGKGTILSIIEKLFEGYTTSFEAKALGSSNGTFSTEVFKDNPLVAIQYDGDLSKIEDNTKLNTIISHEPITMNEKFKSTYTAKVNAFLFLGTNQPVKISDSKSGIIRRLIDVNPSGKTIKFNKYNTLISKIDFELGAIANHCLNVYREMGKNAYDAYRPVEMMFQTDPFLNFIESQFDVFKAQGGCSLKQAYTLYREYCDHSDMKPLPQYKFRVELRNYFNEFHDRIKIDDVEYRSYYAGFNLDKFKKQAADVAYSLVLEETVSPLDSLCANLPAQLAKMDGTPSKPWSSVRTTLTEIDTKNVHYVLVQKGHIVIDFDLKGKDGKKSLDENLKAASLWPSTYGELSQSGNGVHLHYFYDGDTSELASTYADGIEVKVYTGNAALRRRLSKCNNLPVSTIKSGLPLKEKRVIDADQMKSEKGLRDLIDRNLRKDIHPGTKPSIDFIKKILDDAYESGMPYDVTDLRPIILAFASKSSNQAMLCIKTVQKMKFKGESNEATHAKVQNLALPLVFIDVEVFPNLFVVCWKYEGDSPIVKMINPTPQDIEALFVYKLVGFYNRRYDNHILWARFMGYDNAALSKLSQKIIEDKDRDVFFGEAFQLSYADVWDFSSKKQGLKKFEIDLGLPHVELDMPWDKPVPEALWGKVADYCANDVLATEAVFNDRKQDFVARQILADLSGLTVNDTTQKHTAKIIFGDAKNPQREFVYTHLEKEFPGYEFEAGKSFYRGENPGEGGYVYAEPGIYNNVVHLDIASMHPTSIEILNFFGPYTKQFSALKEARLAIKHKNYDFAKSLIGGKLAKYLTSVEDSEALAYALKIVINIVYGLTSAKFDNSFRDVRNRDNIVAKRGALFMIDLKHAVQEKGYIVAHIKTDSIKIPNADKEIIDFVIQFGKNYGYDFEYDEDKDFYDKFCLVNDAVYVAREDDVCGPSFSAVGAQFAHPYVFKTLFTGEEITFDDMCETKSVTKGAMYLDFDAAGKPLALSDQGMHFIGRTGRFIPVVKGGGVLIRIKDDRPHAVTATKGYLWMEATIAKEMGDDLEIDMSYFDNLVDEARRAIEKFGSFEEFVKWV